MCIRNKLQTQLLVVQEDSHWLRKIRNGENFSVVVPSAFQGYTRHLNAHLLNPRNLIS